MLLLRGLSGVSISGAPASRRRRATLQLLVEWGADANDWPELRGYLWDEDADCVIATARIGFGIGSSPDQAEIASALIEGATKINGAQEMETIELLDEHANIARPVAARIASYRQLGGETPNWLSPFWRVLHHLLGDKLETLRHGAA